MSPLPINLGTINQFLQSAHSPAQARALVQQLAGEFDQKTAQDLEERAVGLIGRPPYEAFIREYTAKQWQTDPTDRMVIMRTSRGSRYLDMHMAIGAALSLWLNEFAT